MSESLEFSTYGMTDEHLQEALKSLLGALQWSYAVVWKFMPATRALVWHEGCFYDRGTDFAHLFESIYKRCYFRNSSPGYAFVAFQKQMPLRWVDVQMEPIQTDRQKKHFLLQVGIKTLLCVPGFAPDGTPFCLELATTSTVPGPDKLETYLNNFVQREVAPRISRLPSLPTGPNLEITGRELASTSSLTPGSIDQLSPLVHSMHPGTSSGPEMPAIIFDPPFRLTVSQNLDSVPMPSPNYLLGTLERVPRPYSQWTTTGYHSAPSTSLTPELEGFHALTSGFPETLVGLYHPEVTNPNVPCEWRIPSLDILNTSVGGHIVGEDTLPLEPIPNLPGLSEPLHLPVVCSADLTPFTGLLEFSGSFPTKMQTLDGLESETQVSEAMYQGIDLSNIDTETLVSEWDYTTRVHLQRSDESPGEHLPDTLSFQHSRASPFQVGGHSRQQPQPESRALRQPLIQRWTELYTLAEQDLQRGAGPSSIGSPGWSPRSQQSPVHDEVAHQHKIAEQNRRRIFNGRIETLKSIVPIIKKKDKVSVLTSTIDYIRKLVSHIAELEKDTAPGINPKEEVATTSTLRPDVPSEPPVTATSQAQTAQALGPSRQAGPSPVVNVEQISPRGRTVVIRVEARNNPQTLLQILSVVRDFGLEVNSLDSDCVNSRLRATVSAERVLRSHTLRSCSEVQRELQRVLQVPHQDSSSSSD